MIDLYYFMVMAVALFWIWGFNYLFKQGEILGWPGDYLREKLPEWMITPLIECPYCMSSVHGTGFFILFLWGYPWYMWLFFIVCLTGASVIFKSE